MHIMETHAVPTGTQQTGGIGMVVDELKVAAPGTDGEVLRWLIWSFTVSRRYELWEIGLSADFVCLQALPIRFVIQVGYKLAKQGDPPWPSSRSMNFRA